MLRDVVVLVVGGVAVFGLYSVGLGLVGVVLRGPAVGCLGYGGSATRSDTAAVVCAHNEERVVGECVASLASSGFGVVVVLADRCSDGTVAAARGAGAEVWEVVGGDSGKSGLLTRYLPEVLSRYGAVDVVAVVDADNVAEHSLVSGIREAVARGALVCQARLRTLNGGAGFWPAAIGAAYEYTHWGSQVVRGGWGATVLGGTGMVFTREALRRVPFRAETLTDDMEMTLRFALAGIHVEVLGEAVLDEKPRAFRVVLRQRWRWMSGQLSLVRRFLVPLLAARKFDHALVLVSPLAMALGEFLALLGFSFSPWSLMSAILAGVVLTGVAWVRSFGGAGVVPPLWGVPASWLYSWVWLPAVVGAVVWPASVWRSTEHVGV